MHSSLKDGKKINEFVRKFISYPFRAGVLQRLRMEQTNHTVQNTTDRERKCKID